MIQRIIITALTATASLLGVSAQTTQKLTANKINEYGLIYTLPTTTINVTVEAEKSVKRPGEFYKYSKKFLGLDPITEESITYTLKSVTINPGAKADESERYLVQFKSGSTPYILINEFDFPLSINTDIVFTDSLQSLPVARDAQPTILESDAAKQAMTAEMLQSRSSAKRAELAATRIFEIRQSRSDIISGTAENMPSDGKAMQLVLDNLSRQEAALTAMFIGTDQTSTEVRTFTHTPVADDSDTKIIIGRLSSFAGIVDPDNLAGEPIYLSVKAIERGKLPVNDKGETKRFPKGGLAYRIPGSAEVSVTFNGQPAGASVSLEIAQLGVVFGLDPGLFTDKKAPAYAIFNPLTGAIVEVGSK